MSCFIDTNVLLYFFSVDQSDFRKHQQAITLLTRPDCVLSVQVLQEFFVQATRTNRKGHLTLKQARDMVMSLSRFPIKPQTTELMHLAFEIVDRFRFSYWDSAIVAAALLNECDTLYTEDLQNGQQIESLAIINPFLGT